MLLSQFQTLITWRVFYQINMSPMCANHYELCCFLYSLSIFSLSLMILIVSVSIFHVCNEDCLFMVVMIAWKEFFLSLMRFQHVLAGNPFERCYCSFSITLSYSLLLNLCCDINRLSHEAKLLARINLKTQSALLFRSHWSELISVTTVLFCFVDGSVLRLCCRCSCSLFRGIR